MAIHSKSAISLLIVMVSLGANPLWADQKIKEAELPAAVMAAFQMHFPQARITQAALDKEKDQSLYDIECKEGRIERDLLFAADGTLVEVGEKIDAKELPALVAEAIQRTYGKASIEEAERKTRGAQIFYEVEIETNGKDVELSIIPDGQIQTNEEDDDEQGEDDDE